jgi:hypothetical protein
MVGTDITPEPDKPREEGISPVGSGVTVDV